MNYLGYFAIDWLMDHNDYPFVEGLLKRYLAQDPQDYRALVALGNLYQRWGKKDLAQIYFTQAESLKIDDYYPEPTTKNYQYLVKFLQERKVHLIAVQYPVRPVEPLENILKGFNNVTFVSNENTFKETLRRAKFEDLFTDSFAGNFGHCTPEGNRLLAEQVSKAIISMGQSSTF